MPRHGGLKKSAERIFTKLLTLVELHKGLPFPVSIPNEETVKAVIETNDATPLKRYRSFRELREQI